MGEVGPDVVATFVGVRWVSGSSDGSHRLVFLQVEVVVIGDTSHTSAFLVDTE